MTGSVRPMPATIETERLALRFRDPGDAAWSLELLGERGDGITRTAEEGRARLAGQADEAARNGFGFYAIRLRPGPIAGAGPELEPDPVGYCGLLVGRSTVDEPELAFELFRRAHGNGYATEAAAAVLAAAFAGGRDRIWATVRTWNSASFRVLDELGFRRKRTTIDDGAELVWLLAERPTHGRAPARAVR